MSVLIPARNEAHRISATIESLVQQPTSDVHEILVLDDASTDGTAEEVRRAAKNDERVRVIEGSPLPSGWLGKPWACEQLGQNAIGSALVFTDADVVFAEGAIAAAVTELRDAGLDLLSPYPKQLAESWLERLLQPMVTWTWAATLPIGLAERSSRASLAAANGQFIAVDARAYRAIGGHAAVATAIFDDIVLLRSMKRAGFRGVAANGSELARCRMYESDAELIDGYSKSLWSAFGSKTGAVFVISAMGIVYLMPAAAMVFARRRSTRAIGTLGYLAGVWSRTMVARAFGERILPDVFAHPFSIAGYVGLIAVSWYRKERGTLTWKGRDVSRIDS